MRGTGILCVGTVPPKILLIIAAAAPRPARACPAAAASAPAPRRRCTSSAAPAPRCRPAAGCIFECLERATVVRTKRPEQARHDGSILAYLHSRQEARYVIGVLRAAGSNLYSNAAQCIATLLERGRKQEALQAHLAQLVDGRVQAFLGHADGRAEQVGRGAGGAVAVAGWREHRADGWALQAEAQTGPSWSRQFSGTVTDLSADKTMWFTQASSHKRHHMTSTSLQCRVQS